MKKLIMAAIASVSMSAMSGEELDALITGTGPTVVESDVTSVRNAAFSDDRGVRKIALNSATSVGSLVFRGCMALEEIELNALVDTSRLPGAFAGCPKLVSISLLSVSFNDGLKAVGFPWGVTNAEAVFHFSNGDFDRNGNRIN